MTPEDVKAFFDAHWTVRRFKTFELPREHLDVLLHAAQRAPTDATAQMYSFVQLRDPALRARIGELTGNPHFAAASVAFVVCADVYRLRRVLEARGYPYGKWPAAAVHFSIGDAVMAAQNMLIAAEMLGYRGCWIGGVLSALPEVMELLALPELVFPFAGLVVGVPDEAPKSRPRVARSLILHEDRYRLPTGAEIEGALADMAPITARGDWAQTLAGYFALGGTMEARDVTLQAVLARQGFSHVRSFDEAFARAETLGFADLRVRRRGEGFEAWLDRVEAAHRGEGNSPLQALLEAIEDASQAAHGWEG
ncbi:nitroreductase family protein [Deinococcus peraridilitoris]|uniref:Nitroreductase n=1 Tax=Deinococcus peraridilitoris (strain DSM 19664 / LMG 22246 / CIP 109416 / KR-200) TaxID=937777 RepID=L0A001_DEIPD|nr:nitroreductase [Deinococcus peraridilitoris DSM 19664]